MAGQYVFNLSTKRSQFNSGQDLTEGRYRLTITEPSFCSRVRPHSLANHSKTSLDREADIVRTTLALGGTNLAFD